MIGSRRLGFRTFEKDVDRLDTEIFSGAIPPGPIGTAAWNHIHLIPPSGADVTSYPVTDAGLAAAIADASVAGSIIWVPPGTFTSAITIPANIGLVALGEKVSINAQITLSSGVVMVNIVQSRSESSGSNIVGVVGPSSGIAYMKDCSIVLANSGAGDAYALQGGAGDVWAWNCNLEGNATGGGSGYGIKEGAGEIYVEGGWIQGSTAPTDSTGAAYAVDTQVDTGTVSGTSASYSTISGLVVGNWYALEGTGGPVQYSALPNYAWTIEAILITGGDAGNFGYDSQYGWGLDLPEGGAFIEQVDSHYARIFFQAQETSIQVRFFDSVYGDNSGNMGWILSSATVTGTNIKTNAVRMSPPSGEPTQGDKGVWDALSYQSRHTNDIDDADGIHHTLGDGANQAAPGDHTHDTLSVAGIVEVADDSHNSAINTYLSNEESMVSKVVGGTTYQVFTYWNELGNMEFAWRAVPSVEWTIYNPGITVTGSDDHDFISIGVDPDGYIHVAYDMHNDALNYRKSTNPIETFDGSFGSTLSMLGTNESDVTYPQFLHAPQPEGTLHFTFRDGIAGDGDQYIYTYDHTTQTWAAMAGTGTGGKLIEGKTLVPDEGPTVGYPRFDDDGNLHIGWVWRDDGVDAYDFHDVSYVKWNGATFEQADGTAQTVPITLANCEVVDALSIKWIPHVYSDADGNGNPHIVYFYKASGGIFQIWHAWHNGSSWVKLQITSSAVDVHPRGLAIDRETNTVFIFWHEYDASAEGLRVYKSDGNDFTNWTELTIWSDLSLANNLNVIVKYDWQRWLSEKIFSMFVGYRQADTWPLYYMEWRPFEVTKASHLVTRYEPVTYGGEILFYNNDVLMLEVSDQ